MELKGLARLAGIKPWKITDEKQLEKRIDCIEKMKKEMKNKLRSGGYKKWICVA